MLNEKDLASDPLNILSSLHRKIIMAEIEKLILAGVKVPRDIWEYKVRTFAIMTSNAERLMLRVIGLFVYFILGSQSNYV